jgi:hypothetical protein
MRSLSGKTGEEGIKVVGRMKVCSGAGTDDEGLGDGIDAGSV